VLIKTKSEEKQKSVERCYWKAGRFV